MNLLIRICFTSFPLALRLDNFLRFILKFLTIFKPEAYVYLSESYRRHGRLEMAEKYISQGITSHPDHAGILAEYTTIAAIRGERARAVELWEAYFQNNRKTAPAEAYVRLSLAYRNLGNLDRAEDIARRGMDTSPSHVGLLIEHAEIATERKDWPEAAKRWKTVLEMSDDLVTERMNSHASARLKTAWAASSEHRATEQELISGLASGEFEFIDFGTSKGESIHYAMQFFNAKNGLGIDINEKKIQEAREKGYQAIQYDIHKLPDEKIVRFAILKEFLEHIPDKSDVFAFLRKACVISSDFVFIQQPYFDADGYLMKHGLKLYWSDWRGHPNRMTTLEFFLILNKLKNENLLRSFSIHVRNRIVWSDDFRIHPIDSPIDQHRYSPEKHPPKPRTMKLDSAVFEKTIAFINISGSDHYAPFKNIPYHETIYESWHTS